MTQLRTDLQRQLMGCIVVASRDKLKAGEEPNVTTAELTKMIGRYGQVIGHSCGAMVTHGLLQRVAPSTYRLTLAGIHAARDEITIVRNLP